MKISEFKTKAMAKNGKRIPRVKIIINNKIIEQVTEFIYLGSHLSQYNNQKDIDRNLTKCNRLNGINLPLFSSVLPSNSCCLKYGGK